MVDTYQTQQDLLAVALTKPATKFGVPLAAFYLSVMIVFFAWMLFQLLTNSTSILSIFLFLIIWFGIYAAMFLMTSQDVFGLKIFWINLLYFRRHPSHSFWGNTDTYTS